jgi:hypothetical protein
MGTREKISTIYLKDVYERVQRNELTKYEFHQWLTTYAFKHYNKGMDAMDSIWMDVTKRTRAEK